jgi:hypothetical protein
VTYHFIITMAFGPRQYGWDGTHAPKPGETRAQSYRAIVAATKRNAADAGIPTAQFATLFFNFEPNELAA